MPRKKIAKSIALMLISTGLGNMNKAEGDVVGKPTDSPEINIEYILEQPRHEAFTTYFDTGIMPQIDSTEFDKLDDVETMHALIQEYNMFETIKGGFLEGNQDYNWYHIQQSEGSEITKIRKIYSKEKNGGFQKLSELIGTKVGVGGNIHSIEDRMNKYESMFTQAAEKHSKKHGVKISSLEAMAISSAESLMDPKTVSWSGYFGIMMLGPDLYQGGHWRDGKPCEEINPFSEEESIDRGVEFYARMLKEFKNDTLALTAYNRGPGNVRKAIRAAGTKNASEVLNARNAYGEFIINREGREYSGKVRMYHSILEEHKIGKRKIAGLLREYKNKHS